MLHDKGILQHLFSKQLENIFGEIWQNICATKFAETVELYCDIKRKKLWTVGTKNSQKYTKTSQKVDNGAYKKKCMIST